MRANRDVTFGGAGNGGPVRSAVRGLLRFFRRIVASRNSGYRQHGPMFLRTLLLVFALTSTLLLPALTSTAWGLCPGMLSESYDHIPGCRAQPPGAISFSTVVAGRNAAAAGCALEPTTSRGIAAATAAFRPARTVAEDTAASRAFRAASPDASASAATRVVAAIDLGGTGAVLILVRRDACHPPATGCAERQRRTLVFVFLSCPPTTRV